MELPEFLDAETWNDWIEYRQKESGRKRFGEVAQRRFLKRCEALHREGYDVVALMDYSMDVGWLTVYPKDEFRRKSRPKHFSEGPRLEVVEVDKDKGRAALDEARKAVR